MTAVVSSSHLAHVASILEELAHEVEGLGMALCRDSELSHALMRELQAIDLIAQKQRALAALLVADCPERAIGRMGVEQLQARFLGPAS